MSPPPLPSRAQPRYPFRMTMFRHALALSAVLVLAACGKPAEEAAAPPAATPAAPAAPAAAAAPATPATAAVAIALDAEGLRLVNTDSGATRLLAFGATRAEAVEILTRAHGGVAGKASRNEECGEGPVDFVAWDDGLSALFQDDRFVGWSVGSGGSEGLTTMSGVGIGSTRAELLSAYGGATIEESTLGQEFNAGELYGILDGAGAAAKIDAIWAGTSCVFR